MAQRIRAVPVPPLCHSETSSGDTPKLTSVSLLLPIPPRGSLAESSALALLAASTAIALALVSPPTTHDPTTWDRSDEILARTAMAA